MMTFVSCLRFKISLTCASQYILKLDAQFLTVLPWGHYKVRDSKDIKYQITSPFNHNTHKLQKKSTRYDFIEPAQCSFGANIVPQARQRDAQSTTLMLVVVIGKFTFLVMSHTLATTKKSVHYMVYDSLEAGVAPDIFIFIFIPLLIVELLLLEAIILCLAYCTLHI